MTTTKTHVLSYDIADDGRRQRLARLLEAHGSRVQYSVFELLATRERLDALLLDATSPERFDAAADSLRCYPLCASCLAAAQTRGRAALPASAGRPLIV